MMQHRKDIEGLRGVAVLLIILFHAGFSSVGGGYIGVDVFLVISGFLMTKVINSRTDENRFSFAEFYINRIRRIAPALIIMVATTTGVGFWLLSPRELSEFSASLVSVSFLASNIFFWLNTGYFDTSSELYPLLHTWSLSLEEQFYFIYPLLLFVLRSRSGACRMRILATVGAASFIAAVIAVQIAAPAAFYLLPFRLWEFLVGGCLASMRRRRGDPKLAAAMPIGIAAIIGAALLYDPSTPFPGFAALLPCAGAALVILGGQGDGGSARILSNRVMLYLGSRSYSLYLWHWPIFVFLNYYNIEPIDDWQIALGLLATLCLAELSWRYVEQPFRERRVAAGPRALFALFLVSSVTLAAGGAVVRSNKGFPQRLSMEVQDWERGRSAELARVYACGRNIDKQLKSNSPCSIGQTSGRAGLLWGDSHANSLVAALETAGGPTGTGFYYGADPGCPPVLGVALDQQCIAANDARIAFLEINPDVKAIILVARWAFYLKGNAADLGPAEAATESQALVTRNGRRLERGSIVAGRTFEAALRETVGRLLGAGKTVILVYPWPEVGFDVLSVGARLRSRGVDPDAFQRPIALYDRRQDSVIPMLDALPDHARLIRIYPATKLCDGRYCSTFVAGEPLYIDDDHLSSRGSQLLAPLVATALSQTWKPTDRPR
jgi:peptidoglycan/LPS O-acetylase OafA/YrhL